MGIDLNKIKNRLNTLNNNGKEKDDSRSKFLWKPVAGSTTLRIVPYAQNPDNPFIELLFYYNLGKRNFLSPASSGGADPVIEFAEKLQQAGTKEDWVQGAKMKPKLRTYVPVLVRGEEEKGVRFWAFGKQIYTQLLELIADEDYGDISDPNTGSDLVVTFKTKEEIGNDYGEVSVRAKPKQSKLTEDPKVLDLVRNQPKIEDAVGPEATYDELKEALAAWLNPESIATPASTRSTNDDVADLFADKKSNKNDLTEATVSPATKAELDNDLDNLFN